MKVCVDGSTSDLTARAEAALARMVGSGTIRLSRDSSFPPEAFAIRDEGPHLRISGGDDRGLLYGAGRYCRSPQWRGESTPRRPVRGMYFATHFHNFYHDAPVAEVEDYIAELALWGCNALSVWFDMHHYRSLSERAARDMVERLRAMLRAARANGMATGLTTLANEAYRESPEELRAEWRGGQNGYVRNLAGHYHVELCPSKTGAIEQCLAWRREMLEAFRDIGIDYLWIWPYDQGGCTCADCAPWGANGYLRIAEPYANMVREMMPDTKIVLSTWCFDSFTPGEWEAFYRKVEETGLAWADYLMINPHDLDTIRRRSVPAGLPVLDFPEISMHAGLPWGGYGAHPYPGHLGGYVARTGKLLAGTFPYSEGIFEDINKALMLQWAWDPDRGADSILREYGESCVGEELADDFVTLVHYLEADAHSFLVMQYEGQEISPYATHERIPRGASFTHRFNLRHQPHVEAALALARHIDDALDDERRAAWRWQIVRLRAEIDANLKAAAGARTPALDALFESLNAIYHAANAEIPVVAPSLAALRRLVDGEREAF